MPLKPSSKILSFFIILLQLLIASEDSDSLQIFKINPDSLINPEGYTIKRVEVYGNRVTRERIILREIHSRPDSILTWKELNRDRERLENLQIFSSVTFIPVLEGDSVVLKILLQERQRWFAFPIIFYDESNGWMYGAGGANTNFRGLNEALYLNLSTGGQTYCQLYLYDPWITGNHVSLELMLVLTAFQNYYEDFFQREFSFELGSGSWLTEHLKWHSTLGYRYVHSDRDSITISPQNADYYPYFIFDWIFDWRDLYVNTTRGFYLGLRTEFSLPLASRGISIRRLIIDNRFYLPLSGSFRFAFWEQAIITGGKVPLYNREYIGGSNTIRGWELNSDRGFSLLLHSTELRFDIMKKRVITTGFDLGIAGLLFYDTGSTFDNLSELSQKRFLQSAGAGIRLFLPIIKEARLAYGWKLNGSGGNFTFNTSTRF